MPSLLSIYLMQEEGNVTNANLQFRELQLEV